MNEEQRKLLEQAEKQRQRIKRQNEKAKENWDCVSLKLPAGTKNRIKAKGETVNGLINKLVLEWLKNNS